MRPAPYGISLGFLVLAVSAPPVTAHEFTVTDVLVLFKTDGTYLIDMTVDVDALALGVSPSVDSARLAAELRALEPEAFQACVDRAARTLRRRTRIRFDGEKTLPQVAFPDYGTPLATEAAEPTVLGTTARLFGRVPDGATTFTFGASRAFNAVHLTVLDQRTGGGIKYVLGVSQDSPPYTIDAPAGSQEPFARATVAAQYLVLGFMHILPRGVDHILFVLGLFLLSTRVRPLVWQITAFTVAHSITLALSMYGVVSLPPSIVEPLIALSIAWVAVENLLTTELKPWRPAVVFLFGLLHGLGFAGVLRELGLPRNEFVTAVVTFNVGVEIGQLTVVILAFLLVGWFRHRAWYRPAVVLPASALIAAIGLYWAVARTIYGV